MKTEDYIDRHADREPDPKENLKRWLAMPQWDFGSGYMSYAGFSQGVCLVAGIDPEQSEYSCGKPNNERADDDISFLVNYELPLYQFLPASEQYYGFKKSTGLLQANYSQMKNVEDRLCQIRDFFPQEMIKPKAAISIALEKHVFIPWLDPDVITSDLSILLPKNAMRNRVPSPEQVSRSASKNAAIRASNGVLSDEMKRLILELIQDQRAKVPSFKDHRFEASGKINNASLARRFHAALTNVFGDKTPIPELSTIKKHLRDMSLEPED